MHLNRPPQRINSSLIRALTVLTAVQKSILLVLGSAIILGVFLYVLSRFLFPDWAPIVLIGVVLTSVVTVMAVFWPIIVEYFADARRRRISNEAFSRETDHGVRGLKPRLRGIQQIILREETDQVIVQLQKHKPVLLTGEAGTGKSGIGVALVEEARTHNVFPLLLDARRLISVSTRGDLKDYFAIDEPFEEALRSVGSHNGFCLIIDQLDSVVGSEVCRLLIDLAIDVAPEDIASVVVVSRHREANERGALRPLLEAGFQEVTCKALDRETVERVLSPLGAKILSDATVRLASNLLNLELICEIARASSAARINQLQDEITLWATYVSTLHDREDRPKDFTGEEFVFAATKFAKEGLGRLDRTFYLQTPSTSVQRRLVSTGIIIEESGLRHRFQHEKLQDYLYVRDATQRCLMPAAVYNEIERIHAVNVLLWMRDIYAVLPTPEYRCFLEELLSG